MLFTGTDLHAANSPATPSPEALRAEALDQRIYEARLYLADLTRLERVTYALLEAGAAYCAPRNRKYSIGVPAVSATDFPEDLRRGFAELQGARFSAQPRFLTVLSASPAGQAGIKEGEHLVSMIDEATDLPMPMGWFYQRPAYTYTRNELFRLDLRNGNEKRSLSVRPQLICEQQPRLVRQDELVAKATNGTLTVSTGFLRFIRNDDELALVLGHELAHGILSHANTSPRTGYKATDERAADYLGTYLAVLGGFDTERSRDIWRRLASNPSSMLNGGLAQSHPFTVERAIWQRSIIAEIRAKSLAGQRLMPDGAALPAPLDVPARTAPEAAGSPATTSSDVDPRLARIADVPFVGNSGRSGYQRFLDTPLRPRAFAISPGASTWAYRTGSDAAEAAVKACTQPYAPCYLYAVDDQVVWNPETITRAPNPPVDDGTSPRLNNVARVPFVDAEGRAGYERFLALTVRPRAFAIGPNSVGSAAWSSRTGPNASADALAHCAVLMQGRPCYLYAVDDQIVWSLDNAPVSPVVPPDTATGTGALRRPASSGFADIADIDAVPLPQQQLRTYRAFLEKPAPRAFIVTQEGFGRYWIGTAAMENALTYCERLGEPCWLYAVDNDVVWQPDKNKRISARSQLPRQSAETEFLK